MDSLVSLLNQKAKLEWFHVTMPVDYVLFTGVYSNKDCFRDASYSRSCLFLFPCFLQKGFPQYPTDPEASWVKKYEIYRLSNVTFYRTKVGGGATRHCLLTTWNCYCAELMFYPSTVVISYPFNCFVSGQTGQTAAQYARVSHTLIRRDFSSETKESKWLLNLTTCLLTRLGTLK